MSWVQRYCLRIGCILALVGLVCFVLPIFASSAVAATPATKPADKKAQEQAKKLALEKRKAENFDTLKPPGDFIVSLAKDNQGNIWVGTEDKGVFRFDPNAEPKKQWRQFTTKDGLGDDNAYAIACDKFGRVWVGQLNHGVAVYNGETWRVYDVLDGPIGERIFALATCPVDGDVWMATSAGLTRYRLASDTWSYYTRAEGLPSDQASTIAFDANGNIYVGTQCDGIAISHPARSKDNTLEYKTWRTVQAPDRFGDGKRSPVPLEPLGEGLPTNLINQVLVAKDGTVWVATTTGLAWSKDCGATWLFVRGKDYAAKVRGLYGGPPAGWKEASKDFAGKLILPEDYVTCVSEDDAGTIWVGFRQAGYMSLVPQTKKRVQFTAESASLKDNYVSTILPMSDGRLMIGGYQGGLIRPKTGDTSSASATRSATSKPAVLATKHPPMPQSAKPPTLAELNAMLDDLRAVKEAKSLPDRPMVIPLPDDWRTQGDWLGRYGRYWAVCAAICSPGDYVWGAGWEPVGFCTRIGPNAAAGDSTRYWVHWLYTKNARTLEMPTTYLHSRVLKGLTTWDVGRRQAEWDDHGEAYSQTKDGPDLFLNIRIPPGLFYLSFYDLNKDGHERRNRLRDYRMSIRTHASDMLYYFKDFDEQEELANGRINNFWGGVYKRYLVKGPSRLTIQVRRNYSLNTILAGVMLDLVDEYPPPYYQTVSAWKSKDTEGYDSSVKMLTVTSDDGIANSIYDVLVALQYRNSAWWSQHSRGYYLSLLRYYVCKKTDATSNGILGKLASCYYQLNIFDKWEICQSSLGKNSSREIEKALRWDGNTPSCQKKGYEYVTKYLSK